MMKRQNFIALMMVIALLFSTITFEAAAAPADRFEDVNPKAWYYNDVAGAVDYNLFVGMSDYAFKPTKKITRAQFATAMANLCNADVSGYGEIPFKDVGGKHWGRKYIAWAYAAGVVSGVSATQFAPDRNITRQEMCAMLVRTIEKVLGRSLPEGGGPSFQDGAKIASWARSSVNKCAAAGIIVGSEGKFHPLNNATRAEAAAVIYRYHKSTQPAPILEVSGFYLNFRADQDYYVVTNANFKKCSINKYNGTEPLQLAVEHYPTEANPYSTTPYKIGDPLDLGAGRAKIYLTIGEKKYTIDITDASHADYTFARTKGANVNMRSGAGSEHSVVKTIAANNTRIYYYGMEGDWCRVQIVNGGQKGYIHKDYVKWAYDEVEMPERYKEGIEALKKAHPNWTFSFVDVGVDYASAPAKYNSTQELVDPLNYFNENDIYAFLDIDTYKFGSWTAKQIEDLWEELDGAALNEKEMVAEILTASKSVMMNPLYITCRIALETGFGTSAFAKGMDVVPNVYVPNSVKPENKYETYPLGATHYNFYGIYAYNSNPNYAMVAAKNYGWNTPQKAIIGGASWIKEWYLDRGDVTPYFMRYAYMTDSAYMSDKGAPKKEAVLLKKAYSDPNAKAHFIVPVYRNMPSLETLQDAPVQDLPAETSPVQQTTVEQPLS
ncbi:MAG: S-layer homology domain-containing protein [Clostridia bacterium]|nr:S-layer homology domain-containing protein [Clostridia bacterium]